MKYDIIKTENYLLVVDESEIKDVRPFVGKWHLEKGYILNKFPTYLTDLIDCKLVIAHLPLNGSPILQGVDLLPPLPLEDDGVEKLADKYANQFMDGRDAYYGYKEGYNQAKEKYKYTEEDLYMLAAFVTDFIAGRKGDFMTTTPKNVADKFIQSLSQPKMPIGFECVTETRVFDTYPEKRNINPKTTTTPEGHTQWVGIYIFP